MDQETIRKEWEAGNLVAPLVNIYETEDNFVARINMPGVKKGGAEVKMAGGELLVYGRVTREEIPSDSYVLKEIEDGNYYRVFRVNDAIDVAKIKAKLEDGVLTITLPKHERIKPREIPIEADFEK